MKYVLRFVVLLLFGLLNLPAQELFITIKLDSTNTGSGSPGKGTGYAILSNDLKTLRYRVTVNKLNGTITAAHFHYKPTSGVVQPITFTGKTAEGTWSNIPDSLIAALLNGNLYLNVHSSINAGGEIRGDFNVHQFGFPIVINGANAGTASAGVGTAYAYFEKDKDSAGVTQIRYRATYAGLSGTITAAHFHELPGGTVVNGVTFADSTMDGMWTGFSDDNLLKFFKKQMYLNIHTTNAAGGEVRGNLTVVGELAFAGIMDGAQASTASNGKGTAWAVLRPDMSMKYNSTFAKMTGTLTASHFHSATNGGVVKAVTYTQNNTSGEWTGMSDVNVQDLMKGRIYLNVHSSTNAGGEIRANMFYSSGLFTGNLDGPQASTASTAKGTVWLDVSGDSARYHATIAGLNGNFSAAHFHTTVGGAVIKPVAFVDSTTTGYWNLGATIADVIMGKIYLNVHSSVNAGGEIRGNLKLGSGVATAVRTMSDLVPKELQLDQNYPNPFNPSTTIGFTLFSPGRATLKVYDAIGREVAVLVNDNLEAGVYYQRTFDASKLASGIYFARLTNAGQTQLKKLMLIK